MALSLLAGMSTTGRSQQKERFSLLAPGAVQLTGYLQDDLENSLHHWNMGVVPYDSFVQVFRKGRSFFAEGEMWGKAVRSGSLFYRYTHDPALKKILHRTVQDLLTTIRPNGCISASTVTQQPDGPGGDLWERTYVLLGLERYYTLVDRDPKVLQAMIGTADCTLSQIGPPPKVSILDQGWSPNHIESSTLLDPIMRLYQLTGYRRYLEFARYIVRQGGAKGYNLIRQAHENVPPYKMGGPYPKAYEMMALFDGLLAYCETTGDAYIKTAVLNLFNNIKTQEITLIGNGGGDQPYHPQVYGEAWDHTAVEQTNPAISRMMETCVGVTWMQFCTKVLQLTGDPATVDYLERYIYNGLLGAMKPTGDGFSYVNLLNGVKTNIEGWGGTFGNVKVTCCNLNGPLGLAYIPLVAIMQSRQGPVINLYNAGSAQVKTPRGDRLRLDLESDYPRSGQVTIRLDLDTPRTFTLQLRIPAWSKATRLTMNDQPLTVKAGTYKAVRRKWQAGDRLELQLDMRCRLIQAPSNSDPKREDFVALMRGPVVLARDENLDPAYDQPVTVVADRGYVQVIPEDSQIPGTRMQYRVPVEGGFISMVDYASVNNWDGSHICTWLPLKTKD